MSDRIQLESVVRVTHQPERDRTYMISARHARRLGDGRTGVAIAEHDSHGLCYEVQFPSGLVSYYDRDELEVATTNDALSTAPLKLGTRVQVGSILITDTAGNMKIELVHATWNTIVVERADIDDLVSALDQHLASGVPSRFGSILVTKAFDKRLKISTTHTPSNTITVDASSIDDLVTAVKNVAHEGRE